MKERNAVATQSLEDKQQLEEIIIDSIQEIKGVNVVKLDLSSLDEAPCDSFIVCSGNSLTQVKSIADNVQIRLKRELGLYASHVEGTQSAQWVLIDYFNVVVHVFHPETREFYGLEDLWSDAVSTEYETL